MENLFQEHFEFRRVFLYILFPLWILWTKVIIVGFMYLIKGYLFAVSFPTTLIKAYYYKYIWSNIIFWVDREKKDVKFQEILDRAYSHVEHAKAYDEKETAEFLLNNAIYIVIISLIITVIIIEPKFLSINVFRNILKQSSVRLILALGVGGIIILQGTDLSLGRSVGFAAVITGSFVQAFDYGSRFYTTLPDFVWTTKMLDGAEYVTLHWWFYLIPLLLAMAVSGFFSMINGFVVSVFKVHPFLATLGASVALYGILSMYFGSGDPGPQPLGGFDKFFKEMITGDFVGIPLLIIYAALISVIMWFVWNKTTFGKNMFAVGGNPEAAKISGVSVVRTTVMVYILAGMLYGIGGFLETARIGSVSNATGNAYELDAIAACVVGGISFSGGIGKISGAVAGVLMFTVISFGMNFLGLDVFYQYIIKGVIIVLAVALDTRKYIKKT